MPFVWKLTFGFYLEVREGSGNVARQVDQSGCQGVHSEDKPGDSILVARCKRAYCVSRKDGHLPFNLFQAFFLSGARLWCDIQEDCVQLELGCEVLLSFHTPDRLWLRRVCLLDRSEISLVYICLLQRVWLTACVPVSSSRPTPWLPRRPWDMFLRSLCLWERMVRDALPASEEV